MTEGIPIPKTWVTDTEVAAFREGWSAAGRGLSRTSQPLYFAYNARAAFRDGWDTRTAQLKVSELHKAWPGGRTWD